MLLSLFTTAGAQGFLKVRGKQIVNEKGEEVILRGMGLGGWMLQEPYMLQLSGVALNQSDIKLKIEDVVGKEKTANFYSKWLENHCRKSDIDSLAAWGFNSVRLPMHYNLYTLPAELEPIKGKHTWIEKGFALTDSLLQWCTANKIYLILDLHAAPGGQGKDSPIADYDPKKPSLWENEENKLKTIALWRKIAERYAGEQWIGGYDLINETNWGFSDTADKNGCAEKANIPLRKLLVDITSAIREVDTTHIIFIEGNCWANNYNGIFPLWDKNLVVSFHKYWNYNNTQSIQKFLDIRQQYNVPVWMGESGENSNVWFRNAIALFEEHKIGWAWWPLKKLGINNPLQIKTNDNYNWLLSYWKKEASRPPVADAYKGLMQLAEDLKTENNFFKKDVVDAMFRQVKTSQTVPYADNKIKGSTIVYAVDYDMGRNGYAYYDKDSVNYRVSTNENIIWNKGRAYRNDAVDIEPCNDSITNGFTVTSMEKGEWLQYTVDVSGTATYKLQLRHAVTKSPAMIRVFMNARLFQQQTLSNKNEEWSTVTLKPLRLKKGINTLKVQVQEGTCALNYIRFIPVKKK